MKAGLAFVCLLASVGVACADAPKKSLRPMPRPVLVQSLAAAMPMEMLVAAMPGVAQMRPMRRPDAIPVAARDRPRKGLLSMMTPHAKPAKKPKVGAKGSVCGDPSIKGETLPPVTSNTRGCGIEDPVRVTMVDGVRLSQAATIDCPTARALKTWIQKGMRPAFGRSDVVELNVAAHYVCRPRNNVRGGKISEHGRGKAIDISGFVLSNGKEMSVQGNFNKSIRKAHKAACGIFRTTLGPGSDGYHEDHLHFDTASRTGNAYCH